MSSGNNDPNPGDDGSRSPATPLDGLDDIDQRVNDRYSDMRSFRDIDIAPFWFTKGMPLATDNNDEQYTEGVVSAAKKRDNYFDAVAEGKYTGGDTFERGGERLFIGVPGANSVPLAGMDSHQGRMPPAPDPRGEVNAAEMLDTYAMEQLRDVPFTAWPNELTGPKGDDRESVEAVLEDEDSSDALVNTIEALREDLDRAAGGPGERWYDTQRLFVEAGDGTVDFWGPYISQFLVHKFELWSLPVEQRYLRYEANKDFNIKPPDWRDTLEGNDEFASETDPRGPSEPQRYIATPRHLATIVNAEPPYQEYLIAALQLLNDDEVPLDPGLEYVMTGDDLPDSERVFNYTDGGPVGLLDMVARAARAALLAAFHQKYERHFRCRPETYGGRLHAQLRDNADFGIDELLTNADLIEARPHESDYLSTAYKEGSPVHPAYPSGHSVIAGACGTVLKTWFSNVDWSDIDLNYHVVTHERDQLGASSGDDHLGTDVAEIEVPADHNGVHQEIDKLVSNVGLGRMFAGVHYYSDHYWGVKLGEQVAFALMTDVFANGAETTVEGGPEFMPYLQYDPKAKIQIPGEKPADTLDELRRTAAEHEPGASWPH
ncbi:MAG: hypothetical protein ACI9TI_001807 [Natronomonas sp.]|jgi:hypothetical protein